MILVVEDSVSTARLLAAQIRKYIPDAEVSNVADGDNAFRALTGQRYWEFHPATNSVTQRMPALFTAVIWDNQVPERWGETAGADVGIQTIEALRQDSRVPLSLLDHFISHSGDTHRNFEETGYFARVYPKNITVAQLKELGQLFLEWNIGNPELEERYQMRDLDFPNAHLRRSLAVSESTATSSPSITRTGDISSEDDFLLQETTRSLGEISLGESGPPLSPLSLEKRQEGG